MTTASASTTYKIIRIPQTSPRLTDLVTKFRTTKLSALESDPSSFVSRHATESALPLSVWTTRMSRETSILICTATRTSAPLTDDEALMLGAWVGFAAVRGPMTHDAYFAPGTELPIPIPSPAAETRWHMYDLYTLPAHRGRGLGKRLVNACIAAAVEWTRGAGQAEARIRLFVNPKNGWLVGMYEGLGFRGVGRVSLREGARANDMEESLPDVESTEEGRGVWDERVGLAMERVVRVD